MICLHRDLTALLLFFVGSSNFDIITVKNLWIYKICCVGKCCQGLTRMHRKCHRIVPSNDQVFSLFVSRFRYLYSEARICFGEFMTTICSSKNWLLRFIFLCSQRNSFIFRTTSAIKFRSSIHSLFFSSFSFRFLSLCLRSFLTSFYSLR